MLSVVELLLQSAERAGAAISRDRAERNVAKLLLLPVDAVRSFAASKPEAALGDTRAPPVGVDMCGRPTAARYGPPATAQIIKPYRAPDAPTSVVLAERPDTVDADERGTSLDVTWTEPVIDGGDPITEYLIEWSKNAWSTFTKEVQVITTTGTGQIKGTFYLTLDTSTCKRCPALNNKWHD